MASETERLWRKACEKVDARRDEEQARAKELDRLRQEVSVLATVAAEALRRRDEARAEVERLRAEIAKSWEVAGLCAENHEGSIYSEEAFRLGAESVAHALEDWAERVLAGGGA